MQEMYARSEMNSMDRSLSVEDIMSSPAIIAKEKASIRDIAKMMKRHSVDAVVIVNKLNEPVGIITEGDIVRRLVSSKRNLWFVTAKNAMTKPVVTIDTKVKLEDAARQMAEKKIKKLCVVDGSKKVLGLITTDDITKNASYLINVLKEIIQTGYVVGEEAAFL